MAETNGAAETNGTAEATPAADGEPTVEGEKAKELSHEDQQSKFIPDDLYANAHVYVRCSIPSVDTSSSWRCFLHTSKRPHTPGRWKESC